MQMKLELVPVPVTDVDRAKAFYIEKVGFNADHSVRPGLRFVQLTPPGSACSIVIGDGVTNMPPGTQHGLQMVVADAMAAGERAAQSRRGRSEVDVQQCGPFVYFADPDGNTWAVQGPPPDQSWDHKFDS